MESRKKIINMLLKQVLLRVDVTTILWGLIQSSDSKPWVTALVMKVPGIAAAAD